VKKEIKKAGDLLNERWFRSES